ncbi:hypothetical protein T02_4348 [Trichinella nativa]|uniref:Uncharacterized protein n=1 Tax=Trichinella nativa TaxID=6335 RepID=A0A0V1LUC7_9BILA|nr:hypothetical protein T02_4348 [Trichinella nativa]
MRQIVVCHQLMAIVSEQRKAAAVLLKACQRQRRMCLTRNIEAVVINGRSRLVGKSMIAGHLTPRKSHVRADRLNWYFFTKGIVVVVGYGDGGGANQTGNGLKVVLVREGEISAAHSTVRIESDNVHPPDDDQYRHRQRRTTTDGQFKSRGVLCTQRDDHQCRKCTGEHHLCRIRYTYLIVAWVGREVRLSERFFRFDRLV